MSRIPMKRIVAALIAAMLTYGIAQMLPLGRAADKPNGPENRGVATTNGSRVADKDAVVGDKPNPVKDPKWTVKRYVVPKDKEPDWADNSYCNVCHANFEEENLVMIHQEVGVGCETCHGISMKHSEDENNVTPPDIMWASFRINRRCMTCHLREDLLQGSKAETHQPFFDRLDHPETSKEDNKYCSSCHASKHQVPHRTRIWDRETGKLLKQTGGPAMDR